jgi:putative two-component system response regulator
MFMRTPDNISRETADLIRRMAMMAEYRDPSIPRHLERVQQYVNLLALGMGLSPAQAELISVAAQLHDIGKVGLPEDLLMRAGNLTPMELEATKKHTWIGAEILKDASHPALQMGAAICLSHHERWDGSGYPQGLRGDQIPLGGRLTGLVDVFDALTTARPYKKQISLIEARDMIRETSGQLFDPDLVHVFLENFDQLIKRRLKTGELMYRE